MANFSHSPASGSDDPFSSPQLRDSPVAPIGILQNDSFSPAVLPVADSAGGDGDGEFGFTRMDFGKKDLAGTVSFFERHVFLCYKGPDVWPSNVEGSDNDRLPRLLSAAISSRKADMRKKTRLTICEGEDGTDFSNGDVLIFPDMVRYRKLTHFDADNFVEEVLVKETEWLPGTPETMTGPFIFVCAHGSRDQRCGVCGPALISRFKEEIGAHDLDVSVSACSHIGGHKYAGNVIIFRAGSDGKVKGDWYGYVTPNDVPLLLEQHVGKGQIVDHLWRGQMGMSGDEQKKAFELMQQAKDLTEKTLAGEVCITSCCQGSASCCQNGSLQENPKETNLPVELKIIEEMGKEGSKPSTTKASGTRKPCSMPKWYETFEREDMYAALAVVAAAGAVFVAYRLYKQSN